MGRLFRFNELKQRTIRNKKASDSVVFVINAVTVSCARIIM